MIIGYVLLIVYLISIIVAAVLAVIYQKGLREYGLFPLALFLPYVAIQETVLTTAGDFGWNGIFYDIYRVLNVIVFTIVFANNPLMKRSKNLIIGICIGFITIMIIACAFFGQLKDPNGYTGLLRSAVITVFAIIFLSRFFDLDNVELEKKWRPLVLIVIGLLLFYPVISISLIFQKYLYARDATLYGLKLYQAIPKVMSLFMYPIFSYAFYLCHKKNSTSLSLS